VLESIERAIALGTAKALGSMWASLLTATEHDVGGPFSAVVGIAHGSEFAGASVGGALALLFTERDFSYLSPNRDQSRAPTIVRARGPGTLVVATDGLALLDAHLVRALLAGPPDLSASAEFIIDALHVHIHGPRRRTLGGNNPRRFRDSGGVLQEDVAMIMYELTAVAGTHD
jgi:hypothetical protein